MSELGWVVVERVVPAVLVLVSVPLLLMAVGARFVGGPVWLLFGAGVAAWCAGVGWGLLVNRLGPALAAPH